MMERAKTQKARLIQGLYRYTAPLLLLLFIAVEFFAKYQRYAGATTNIQQLAKGIVAVALGSLLLLSFKKSKILILGLALLAVVFAIGQLTLDDGFSRDNALVFSRFVFPLILFGFFNVFKPDEQGRRWFFQCFEMFLAVNFALLVSGVFTETYVLKTYMGGRFGYNGLLVTSATSTYVYLCGLGYFYFKKPENYYRHWLFWVVVASCLLVGTKTLYLGLVLFGLIAFAHSSFRFKKQLTIAGTLVLALCVYLLFYKVPLFREIQEKDGLLTAVLSYRDKLFLEQTWPYIQDNWNLLNYLFGGTSDYSLRSQMDVFDTLFFWGAIGTVIFFWVYAKTYFTFLWRRKHISFFLLLGLAVVLSGNFFSYTSVPIYLVILRESICNQQVD